MENQLFSNANNNPHQEFAKFKRGSGQIFERTKLVRIRFSLTRDLENRASFCMDSCKQFCSL